MHQTHGFGSGGVCVADPHIPHCAAVTARQEKMATISSPEKLRPDPPAGVVGLIVVGGVAKAEGLDRIFLVVELIGESGTSSTVGARHVAEAPESHQPASVDGFKGVPLQEAVHQRIQVGEARVRAPEQVAGSSGGARVGRVCGSDKGFLDADAEGFGLLVRDRIW